MAFLINFFVISFLGLCNGVPPQPRPDSDSRIIGGDDAPQEYAPHMVSLISGGRHSCGGSIVSRCHVLTAAHCLTHWEQPDGTLSSSLYGRIGSKNWKEGGTIITFSGHHIHPKYDEDNIKYDVGILEISHPLELSEDVVVIALDLHWVEGNEKGYVTGWGRTGPRQEENSINLAPTPDDLQLLYVETLDPEQCSHKMETADFHHSNVPHIDPEVEICTFHSVGHGMCHGDSGSALVSTSSSRQIGVVSWGLPCAVGAPDVFTRLNGEGDNIYGYLARDNSIRPDTYFFLGRVKQGTKEGNQTSYQLNSYLYDKWQTGILAGT